MAPTFEEPLPMYGLTEAWRGDRRRRERGGRTGSDVLDVWAGVHYTPNTGEEIVVRTQRRAIHGGPDPAAPRVTGPEQLVKHDAAWSMVEASRAADFAALRAATDPGEWRRVHAAYSKAMDDDAERISRDDGQWQPVDLTIDGSTVDAIEATWEGWWVVLHIGVGEIADVLIYGPSSARPMPLQLQSLSAPYPQHPATPDSTAD
jgi:hypothetical protein